ncbi:hypothetical protein [Acidocella aminolytica]
MSVAEAAQGSICDAGGSALSKFAPFPAAQAYFYGISRDGTLARINPAWS